MRLKSYLKMKDSGIEWVGQIPEHWKSYKLKLIFNVVKNGIWGEDQLKNENDIICVRVSDFDRNHNRVVFKNPTFRNISHDEKKKHLLEKGDILLERSGGGEKQPVGFTAIYDDDKDAVCSNFISRLNPKKDFNGFFLNYLFAAMYFNRENLKYINQTTGIQNLDSDYLEQIYPLPPLGEQIKISKFLKEKTKIIDNKIHNSKKLFLLLKEKKQTIINQAVTQGLDPSVPMKESGVEWIGKIPKHWSLSKLERVSDVIDPHPSHRNPPLESNGIPFLVVGDLDLEGNIIKIGHEVSEELLEKQRSRFRVTAGDMGIGRVGTIGRVVLLNPTQNYCLSGRIGVIKPKKYSRFLFYSLISNNLQHQIEIKTESTTIGVLRIMDLRKLVLALPIDGEHEQISNYLDKEISKIDSLILKVNSQIKKLEECQKSLVSSTITGKIDVREALLN